MVSTSRMRGMLSSSIGPSARTVLARIGSAAFLLPGGTDRTRAANDRRERESEEAWPKLTVPVSASSGARGLRLTPTAVVLPVGACRRPLAARHPLPWRTPWESHTARTAAGRRRARLGRADHGHLARDHRPLGPRRGGGARASRRSGSRAQAETISATVERPAGRRRRRRSRPSRRLTEQAQDLMVLVRHEAGAFAQTSRRVRRKVVRGVDRVEEQAARSGDALRSWCTARSRTPPSMWPRRSARCAAATACSAGFAACSWPAGHDARAPRARLRGRGARAPGAARRGPRLDAGHAHLSGRIGPRRASPSSRPPWPICSAPTRSISSTATSRPTPPSRSTTPRSAATVTTGTWARRSTTWPPPTRSARSAWATSATSPPTPSPTTTSCPASS